MSIQAYMDFLKEIKDYKPVSIKKMTLLINKIEASLGRSLIAVETGSEVEKAIVLAAEFRKKVFNGGFFDNGQHTKFRMGLAAACYLRWAHGEGLMNRNPYSKNTFRRPPKREAGYLDDNDLNLVLNNEKLSVFEHAMIRFILDTAIRRDEFLKVKMADTDFLERTVHIPEAKGDKFRTVPFTERTLFWLEAYLSMRGKKSEYLFCNEDGDKIGYQAMGQYFQYISVKVKFRLHAHMLRHTAGRLWAEAGINQGLICRFMGHETTTMTNQYIHTSAKKLKELQNTVYQNNLFLSVKV